MTILGNEPPYEIEVTVSIERSSPDDDTDYSVTRYDEGLANKLLRNIVISLRKERAKSKRH